MHRSSLIKKASKEIAQKLLEDESDLKDISYAVNNDTEWEKFRESIFAKAEPLLHDFIKANNFELAYQNKTDFRRDVFISLRQILKTEAIREYQKEMKGEVSFDFPQKDVGRIVSRCAPRPYIPSENEGPEVRKTGPNEFTEVHFK